MNSNDQKIKLREILIYVENEINKGNYPSYKQINEKFNISYYKITLKDIYLKLGINILNLPFKRPSSSLKELHKNLIEYIKEEVKKGHYPSGQDIEKKFGMSHIWNFVTMKELYHRLDLPAYLEREKRK